MCAASASDAEQLLAPGATSEKPDPSPPRMMRRAAVGTPTFRSRRTHTTKIRMTEVMTCCCDIIPTKADASSKNVWFNGDVEGKGHLRWRRVFIAEKPILLFGFLLVSYALLLPVFIAVGNNNVTWSKAEAAFDLTNVSLAFMYAWAILKCVVNFMHRNSVTENREEWNTDESPVPVFFQWLWAFYVIGTTLTVTNAFVYIIHVAPGPMQTRPADMYMARAFVQAVIVLNGLFITREPFIGMQIIWPVLTLFFYAIVVSIGFDASFPKSHVWIGVGLCIVVYGCLLRIEYATQVKIKGYAFFHVTERTAAEIRAMTAAAESSVAPTVLPDAFRVEFEDDADEEDPTPKPESGPTV